MIRPLAERLDVDAVWLERRGDANEAALARQAAQFLRKAAVLLRAEQQDPQAVTEWLADVVGES